MHVAELELGDIMSGDRDALDGTADDVPLQEGDHVSDTVTWVNDSTHKCVAHDLFQGPGCSEGKYGLDSNVEPLNIEWLKEDLSSVFMVLRQVERRFSLSNTHHVTVMNTKEFGPHLSC